MSRALRLFSNRSKMTSKGDYAGEIRNITGNSGFLFEVNKGMKRTNTLSPVVISYAPLQRKPLPTSPG